MQIRVEATSNILFLFLRLLSRIMTESFSVLKVHGSGEEFLLSGTSTRPGDRQSHRLPQEKRFSRGMAFCFGILQLSG